MIQDSQIASEISTTSIRKEIPKVSKEFPLEFCALRQKTAQSDIIYSMPSSALGLVRQNHSTQKSRIQIPTDFLIQNNSSIQQSSTINRIGNSPLSIQKIPAFLGPSRRFPSLPVFFQHNFLSNDDPLKKQNNKNLKTREGQMKQYTQQDDIIQTMSDQYPVSSSSRESSPPQTNMLIYNPLNPSSKNKNNNYEIEVNAEKIFNNQYLQKLHQQQEKNGSNTTLKVNIQSRINDLQNNDGAFKYSPHSHQASLITKSTDGCLQNLRQNPLSKLDQQHHFPKIEQQPTFRADEKRILSFFNEEKDELEIEYEDMKTPRFSNHLKNRQIRGNQFEGSQDQIGLVIPVVFNKINNALRSQNSLHEVHKFSFDLEKTCREIKQNFQKYKMRNQQQENSSINNSHSNNNTNNRSNINHNNNYNNNNNKIKSINNSEANRREDMLLFTFKKDDIKQNLLKCKNITTSNLRNKSHSNSIIHRSFEQQTNLINEIRQKANSQGNHISINNLKLKNNSQLRSNEYLSPSNNKQSYSNNNNFNA